MNVLICAATLFAVFFLFHIGIWRIFRPKNTIKALLIIFFSVFIGGILVMSYFDKAYPQVILLPHRFPEYLYISVLFFSVFSTYFFSYPAIEADSPSISIVMRINQAGKSGLPEDKIRELLRKDLLIEPRLNDIVNARLVDVEGQVYRINNKGIFFIRPFVIYRNFLGLGKGG